MKKLLLVLAAVGTLTVSAQNKDVEALQKRLEKSDAALADAKKGSSASTWVDRANLMIDMANVYTSSLIAGFPVEATIKAVGEPTSKEELEVAGTKLVKYDYPTFFFFASPEGQVQFWSAKQEMLPDALYKAIEYLDKAKNLSDKDFKSKGIPVAQKLQNQFTQDGMSLYSQGRQLEASKLFTGANSAANLRGAIDTTMIYYAGITAFEGGDYPNALANFDKVVSLGEEKDGMIYYYISSSQEKAGDKVKAVETLEKAFAKYPNNQTIMSGLINIYMLTDQEPSKLIDLVKKAQSVDPQNASLFLVEGTIWDKLGDLTKAEEAFAKSIALNDQNFGTFYNLAITRAKAGDALVEKAGKLDINDQKGYDDLIAQAVELYTKSIDAFEKAHALDATEKSTIEMLRTLYFQKRDDSPEMMAKYQHYDEIYQKIKGGTAE